MDTDGKKLAYENSDGANGLKEVSQISAAPQDTVYSWWQKWFRLGIVVESDTRKGRMKKIIALDDLGIRVPRKTKAQAIPPPTQQPNEGDAQTTGTTGEPIV